ncbi:MAG: twin-arginine translocation signal domain-containing protein, partial [Verrucomicrobiae bacterium]|nr:twin-arginine translocation signal domain-containing protein [Verrucomicrobiae bacterium]
MTEDNSPTPSAPETKLPSSTSRRGFLAGAATATAAAASTLP